MSRFSLEGKVAIVTGASSGLGVEFGRRVERLEQTRQAVEELGPPCLAVEADVTRPEDCERVVAEALRQFGHVEVLVDNAGVGTAVPATRETPEEFRAVIDVNLFGSYWMAQAYGRVMKPGSSIVNVGSVIGSTSGGLPQAAYITGVLLPVDGGLLTGREPVGRQ